LFELEGEELGDDFDGEDEFDGVEGDDDGVLPDSSAKSLNF
jgi:hypothetical protein